MAKSTTNYVCQTCGTTFSKWSGKCDSCGAWNSLVEQAIVASGSVAGSKRTAVAAAAPEKLADVTSSRYQRISSGIADVDQVLGGGIVPGSITLLSGDPGIGKSTLVLQLAALVAQKGSVLYVSGEESASQIKLRADRLGVKAEGLSLLCETSADVVASTIEHGKYDLVIIDSIQTMAVEALSGSPGTVGQITASSQQLQSVAKKSHVAMIMIGHVTKEGSIAGPKILEHLVDVVLYLEGERYGAFKALRGIKNRFGSTSEVGIFEMTDGGLKAIVNPSAALLAERQPGPGSVVLPTLEGTRPVLVEVQALVSTSVFGYPKRTAVGIDLNRLNILVAVLTKRAGLNLSNQDIYVNIVGGLKITEPAADLAVILSIASAFKNSAVIHDVVAFGEVGLSGELRSVTNATGRLKEAAKLGFSGAVGPQTDAAPKGLQLHSVRTVGEAVEKLLKPIHTT